MRHDTGSVIVGQNFRCLYDNFLTFQNFCVKVFIAETLRTSLQLYSTEAGISKNYCATKLGSPEVALRYCPWTIHIVQILNWAAWPEIFSMSLLCVCNVHRGTRPKVSP
jgi:hypothetical protein